MLILKVSNAFLIQRLGASKKLSVEAAIANMTEVIVSEYFPCSKKTQKLSSAVFL